MMTTMVTTSVVVVVTAIMIAMMVGVHLPVVVSVGWCLDLEFVYVLNTVKVPERIGQIISVHEKRVAITIIVHVSECVATAVVIATTAHRAAVSRRAQTQAIVQGAHRGEGRGCH